MQQIPLQTNPSQIARVVLGGQNVQLFVYQKEQGLFVDVAVGDTTIVSAALALNETPIICRNYAGFRGNLYFLDTQGSSDPDWSGLAERFALIYVDDDDDDLLS